MSRGRSRGSITLEMALAVPVMFLMIWGGAAVAYSSYAKAALQMTVARAARELAASGAAARIEQDSQLYKYGEFTETYGLPRPRVKMLVGKQGEVILAGACYRVRLPLPQMSDAAPPQAELPFPVAREGARVLGVLRDLVRKVEQTWSQGTELWEQIGGLVNQISQFGQWELLADEFTPLKQSFSSPTEFDRGVKRLCPGRGLTVIARAAFWSEERWDRPQNDSEDGESRQPLQLTLTPSTVDVTGTGPDTLRQVTLDVQAAEPTECKVQVRYKSGDATADGLNPRHKETDASGSVSWTWNVGSTTHPGSWPVSVSCANGQSGSTMLTVIDPDEPAPGGESG